MNQIPTVRRGLVAEILGSSKSQVWDQARLEWMLHEVRGLHPYRCPCGQYPCKEVCVLKNKITGMEVIVGNNCVFHFMGIDARPIFKFLKLIKGNPAASLNEPSIMQAKREGLFSNWEYTFYLDIRRQRILSDKQRAIKIRINRKIRDHWTRPPKLQRKNAVPYWLRFPESPKEQP